MRRRAVVFDLDGTLVDSVPDIAHHLATTLLALGHRAPTVDEVAGWVGSGAKDLVTRALRETAPHAVNLEAAYVTQTHHDFLRRYAAAPVRRTQAYPGVAAMLAQVAAWAPLAILSNKPHDLTQTVVHHALGGQLFAHVQGHRPDGPLKPDPAALRHVLNMLDVAPGNAIMVGDADPDYHIGQGVGVPTIMVSWGTRTRAQLAALGATHIVDDAAALTAALQHALA